MALPLVTNEGFGVAGMRPPAGNNGNILTKAEAAGVATYTPGPYYAVSGRDEGKDIRWSLERFEREASDYVSALRTNAEAMRSAVDFTEAHYRHVLLGTTDRQREPATVKVVDCANAAPGGG